MALAKPFAQLMVKTSAVLTGAVRGLMMVEIQIRSSLGGRTVILMTATGMEMWWVYLDLSAWIKSIKTHHGITLLQWIAQPICYQYSFSLSYMFFSIISSFSYVSYLCPFPNTVSLSLSLSLSFPWHSCVTVSTLQITLVYLSFAINQILFYKLSLWGNT